MSTSVKWFPDAASDFAAGRPALQRVRRQGQRAKKFHGKISGGTGHYADATGTVDATNLGHGKTKVVITID
ncbi:MAG: hypothetical protein QOF76_2893 [Solirubrobacteraceae bacterium]|jgi:hypothetical protein|nr:hypothetical protein [Solirubrobacteraceae bacterium]